MNNIQLLEKGFAIRSNISEYCSTCTNKWALSNFKE